MKIHLIAAARPNFMKIAPLYHALKKEAWAEPVIVHTGQHYDLNMSDVFFEDLGIPEPDIHLGVGSSTHAEQTGQVMMAYEKVLFEDKPDLVVVVGDVNSTMAATLAAVKLPAHSSKLIADSKTIICPRNLDTIDPKIISKAKVAATIKDYELSAMSYKLGRPLVGHLEAGLRSFDRTMPEEINRLVTDALADILWTPSADADENLIREGVSKEKIRLVGNIMIDSLEMLRDRIQAQATGKELGLKPQAYGIVTLHRPSNVDEPKKLKKLFDLLSRTSKKIPLVLPLHPRTRKNAANIGILPKLQESKNFLLLEPLNYIRFMNLVFNCRFALTDSGGIQEETAYLGIPCITLRPNTERPITITKGTNRLCELENLEQTVEGVLAEALRQECHIPLWDGKTAERVVNSIKDFFN
jgi:UDP-N-acetylglucosamine 2-epimerase (non-hydrolysing)